MGLLECPLKPIEGVRTEYFHFCVRIHLPICDFDIWAGNRCNVFQCYFGLPAGFSHLAFGRAADLVGQPQLPARSDVGCLIQEGIEKPGVGRNYTPRFECNHKPDSFPP